jgi:threonine/homoserine/homoserine lactone efflux protein
VITAPSIRALAREVNETREREMGQAIGDMLPAAVGVAISPIPIIAVVLMLVSPHGRVNGPAYLGGQLVGVAAAGAIVLLIAGGVGRGDDGEPAGWVSWLKLVLGVLLVLLAVKQWRDRPRAGESAATPKWMEAIDDFTPPKAFGAGIVLSAFNPKNLILTVAGVAAIVSAGIAGDQEVIALVVFTIVGSLGVAIPVVIYFALGDRSAPLLGRLKEWMAQNNAVIMAVILLLIGVKLLGDAISGFSS